MAPDRDHGVHSDTENGEKPVREQLKNARITHEQGAVTSGPSGNEITSEEKPSSGNDGSLKPQPQELRRKRSFEEVDETPKSAPSESVKHHNRKRSRDSTTDEFELNNGRRKNSGERSRNSEDDAEGGTDTAKSNGSAKPPRPSTPEASAEKQTETTVQDVASPKTKRSRLLSSTEDEKADSQADKTEASTSNGTAKETATTTKIPPTSGFANASATSPFGALAGSKSPSAEPTTSSSAFAASGFSALSGSSTSGFGSIAKSGGGFGSGGSFASGAKSPLAAKEPETSKPSSSGFGGALGQTSAFASAGSSTLGSGFGSTSSGFGRIGSPNAVGFGSGSTTAFGSSALGGGGLSSFASGKSAPAPLGGTSKPSRAFGAPAAEADDDNDSNADDNEEGAGIKSPLSEEEKQDERFYAQSLETGEEDEVTAFTSRAKLYNFTYVGDGEKEGKKKEWRERGLGVLRLNVKDSSDGEKTKARLLMRADGSHRVVLNTPVTKEIKFGTPSGGPPQGGYMYFMGTIGESGGLELLQVKMKQQNCLDLYEKVIELQESM